jgi:hypothetical protein
MTLLIGVAVVATLTWQSYFGRPKEETVAAATPVSLDSVRQSIDNLTAEIAKLRAVEQDILERRSAASLRPVTNPTRNPALRPSPVR